ncbi:hypothetical protein MPNT_40020 [Candidatus Methylacidithermus pantelleriae]|uniref:Uncharacterized protein n=1 Tax=Candidatus Methylacidithermus pantelleriae TaxID=2744239 RepID=A0A8J2FT66_9BACT|nr:hypothetical protein MPNT_40020 [Candidatus Methylacidithermus pantelleriae]
MEGSTEKNKKTHNARIDRTFGFLSLRHRQWFPFLKFGLSPSMFCGSAGRGKGSIPLC